jgi:phosphatidylglycerol lysyltransferase
MALALLAFAGWLIWRDVRDLRLSDVLRAVGSTPKSAILLAVLFTFGSYGCLAVGEWTNLWLFGRRLPVLKTAACSFATNAISAAIGFGMATGSALRLRFYRWSGLRARQLAAATVSFSLSTYLAGLAALGLFVFSDPRPLARATGLPSPLISAAAVALASPSVLWFTAYPRRGRRLGLKTSHRAKALAAALGDWLLSGSVLFVLSGLRLEDLPPFLAVFCFGSLLGSIVGIPGGIGVLEATVLRLAGHGLPHETVAALILYRVVYFVGPLTLSLLGLGGWWLAFADRRIRCRRRAGRRVVERASTVQDGRGRPPG